MSIPFEWFVALRYLRAKRKQAFISLITFISIAGVAVGVMALIVVISVMAGFENHLRTKILGINSHIVLRSNEGAFSHPDEIAKRLYALNAGGDAGLWGRVRHLFGLEDGGGRVVAASPFVYVQALVSSGRFVSGALIRGVDPKTVSRVIQPGQVVSGQGVSALAANAAGAGPPPILLGKELARNLNVGVGQTIQVVLPSGTISPVGMMPRIRTFRVAGITTTGMYDYDASLAFISIGAAQKLLGLGDRVQALELKVSDIYAADALAKQIDKTLGFPFWSMDWQQTSRSLFSALKLERLAMFIVLTLIVLVAAFNIVSTLIMMVMEKQQDIAILKAIGATDGKIMRIFVYNGALVGLIGTLLGSFGGVGLCALLSRYKFIKIPSDVYYTDTLPILLDPVQVAVIAVSAILICFFATIYPARQAARVNPSEALRTG